MWLLLNMSKESTSQEFRLKNIEETRNYSIKEIDLNELMNKKHRKICTTLKYIQHFLFASVVTGYVSFLFSVSISIESKNSVIRFKNYAIIAAIKKYWLIFIIQKNEKEVWWNSIAGKN